MERRGRRRRMGINGSRVRRGRMKEWEMVNENEKDNKEKKG